MTISEYHFLGYGTAPGQEESMSTIFKGKYGEVWRHGENYGTRGAGFELCKELAAEIERLRDQLGKLAGAVNTYCDCPAQIKGQAYGDMAETLMWIQGNRDLGGWPRYCQRLEDENERLRTELAAAQKLAEVGAAIERARELPEGWEISIRLEQDSGTVNLFDTDGSFVQFPTNDYALHDTINDAVRRAKENG